MVTDSSSIPLRPCVKSAICCCPAPHSALDVPFFTMTRLGWCGELHSLGSQGPGVPNEVEAMPRKCLYSLSVVGWSCQTIA